MNQYDPKEIFVVSPIKRAFQSGNSIIGLASIDLENPFELANLTVYSQNDNAIIKSGSFNDYARNFIAAYSKTEILNRKEFLDFQYEGSQDKKSFIETIKTMLTNGLGANAKRQMTEWLAEYPKKPEITGKSNRPNRTDIAFCIYYLKETKALKTNTPFPSDAAYQELGTLYKKNWENIKSEYAKISSSLEERTRKRKLDNLSYVLTHMLPPATDAYNLAKSESIIPN